MIKLIEQVWVFALICKRFKRLKSTKHFQTAVIQFPINCKMMLWKNSVYEYYFAMFVKGSSKLMRLLCFWQILINQLGRIFECLQSSPILILQNIYPEKKSVSQGISTYPCYNFSIIILMHEIRKQIFFRRLSYELYIILLMKFSWTFISRVQFHFCTVCA